MALNSIASEWREYDNSIPRPYSTALMKVLLLIPPIDLHSRMGRLKQAGAVMPGLGVLYIAGVLERNGFNTTVIDAEGLGLDLDQTIRRILAETPDLLGVTATTLSIYQAAAVAERVKSGQKRIRVVIGGPHATALPHDTMELSSAIDACVLGEGENAFIRIAENIRDGREMDEGLDGIIFRKEKKLIHRSRILYMDDPDNLPFPAWHLLEGFPAIYRPPFHSYRRLPVANIITTRGCPHVCSFCDRSVFGKKVRSHSVGYVIEMIRKLVRDFGIREISIKDDMFVLSQERVYGICRGLQKAKLDITWSCNARVSTINDALLREMKSAGCWMISYGIESGSKDMLRKMMKGISRSQIEKALTLTRKNGIVSKGFFMIGIPEETVDTLNQTADYIKRLPLDEINVNLFTPFPGSQLYKEVLEEGFVPDFRRMNMVDAVYVPPGLSKGTLRGYQKKIIFSFYLNPRKLSLIFRRSLTDMCEFRRLLRMGRIFLAGLRV